jgi:glycosyltransferase domain-containing protein
MKKLNKLSIIIPSYNRKKYLKRQIIYWANTPYKIFILDGGTENFTNQEVLKLPNNIRYIIDNSNVFERIANIKKNISSKYILLLCDDDFYVKQTLQKIINFLDCNKEYLSSSSLPLGFRKINTNLIYEVVYPEIKKRIKLPENKDSYRRLNNYFKFQYNIYNYSVIHTSIFFECVKLINKCNFDLYALSEVLFGIRLSLASKHKIINEVGWLRNIGNPPIRYKGIFYDPSMRIGDWLRVDKQKNNIKLFFKFLCKELKLNKNFIFLLEKRFRENYRIYGSIEYPEYGSCGTSCFYDR